MFMMPFTLLGSVWLTNAAVCTGPAEIPYAANAPA